VGAAPLLRGAWRNSGRFRGPGRSFSRSWRYSRGVHALDPQHWQPGTPALLRAKRRPWPIPGSVAIGETGAWICSRLSNLDQQLAMLRPQLDLAIEAGSAGDHSLPRRFAGPMLEELGRRQQGMAAVRGVHALLGGTPMRMKAFLAPVLSISSAGTVTFQQVPPKPTPVPQVPSIAI